MAMPSLPVKSWLSFSEGFLSPPDVVRTVAQNGGDCLVFADSGEISSVPEVLWEAAKQNLPAVVGMEFLLEHNGRLRRIAAFARGKEGLKDLFSLAANLRHPSDPERAKGGTLPGSEVNLPTGTLADIKGKLILVSGGSGSYFEDCRARGDALGFLKFVDDIRASGVGVAAGYDPALADPRDPQFLGSLRSGAKPVAILPWRWTSYPQEEEEMFHTAERSVFGKSPTPEVLRAGGAIGSMSQLKSPIFLDSEISAFSKAAGIAAGEFPERPAGETLLYKDSQGKILSSEQACEVLRQRAVKNLDAMISKTGLRGDRAQERRNFYLSRLDSELSAISQSGVAGRMLYVADLMTFCRKRGIKAMARGSAANSLVCYLNRISPVNPVTFELPSERFINPRRGGSPDIDVDVAASRAGEAREFLCREGGGGVLLRSTVTAGFVDILQRELRSAGVPYAHELRERLRTALGGRRIPNTYEELESEYARFSEKNRDLAGGNFHEFISARFASVNPETMEAAINSAKFLEGRPFYHVDHVGVAMRPSKEWDYVPLLRGKSGEKLLAAGHEQAEALGFAKIDVLARGALDLVDRIQSAVEKSGGKCRAISSVFSATRQPLDELRMGLVGGLDQIGPSGRSQIPHRQFLGSWEEEFTNHDLVNYLALVRYGTRGWSKGSRPEGEHRPRMLALYCGSMAASPALEELGKSCAKMCASDCKAGKNCENWADLAQMDGKGAVPTGKNGEPLPGELRKRLLTLPATLAQTESLGGGAVGGKLLARITWGGEGDKKAHLNKCEEAVKRAEGGDESPLRRMLADFYRIPEDDAAIGTVCESLASGKVIQRPDYISKLGKTGAEAWDKSTASSRGLLLFQEQVTDLLRRLSGCEYSVCDLVRDSIAHKDRALPEEVKAEIIKGVDKTTGVEGGGATLLRALTDDAPYLFNKGHAAVYAGLISWQLENKKNWPASFAGGYVEHLRATGAKSQDARAVIGSVLGDAVELGCTLDVEGLPYRTRTEVVEKAGEPGTVKLGLDSFLNIGESTLQRLSKMETGLRAAIGKRGATPDDLCKMPIGLTPDESELIFAIAEGGTKAMKAYHKHLGIIPDAIRNKLVSDTGGATAAEDLNFYRSTAPKVANVWGFVLSPPQVAAGQGKRPCRVSCQLGNGTGREPVEISYVFWPERGKEGSGFLPKEAVDLQARLNSFHQRGMPMSTVVRLNNFFGRWDGSVTALKSLGRAESPVSAKKPEAAALPKTNVDASVAGPDRQKLAAERGSA